jgi:uncharacterized membrane protein YdfJ with MMPL/SSD domain
MEAIQEGAWFYRWGYQVARFRWALILIWVLAIFALAPISLKTGHLLSPEISVGKTEPLVEAQLAQKAFPFRKSLVLFVALTYTKTPTQSPAYAAQIQGWVNKIKILVSTSHATQVKIIPSKSEHSFGILVLSNVSALKFTSVVKRLASVHIPGPGKYYVGGPAALYNHFISYSEAALQWSERVTAPIAFGFLILVFGGLIAAAVPVIAGLAAVVIALACLAALTKVATISIFALNISSIVGLGLGIDYSLLVVTRFREELAKGYDVPQAVARTVASAGRATLVSGGTVMTGFGFLMLSHSNLLWSIGLGGSIVVAASILSSLLLIPSVLAALGRNVNMLAFRHERSAGAFWLKLSNFVMKHAYVAAGVALLMLLVLAYPAKSIYLGTAGIRDLPPNDSIVVAQKMLSQKFGFPANPSIEIISDKSISLASAFELQKRLENIVKPYKIIGPATVGRAQLAAYYNPPYALYEVATPAPANSKVDQNLVERIESSKLFKTGQIKVGGEPAIDHAYVRYVLGDFPLIFTLVLLVTFVVLGVALRSVVLATKAVVMNLFSVLAALGVLTFIFQQGHFASLLQFTPAGYTVVEIPVIIFASLFGLSMDYEVFLLSRIREEYLKLGDNTQAVTNGMARTGRIITSAALIMAFVAGSLVESSLTVDKAIGLVFAVAVLIDATIIRLILVPALMRIFGTLNWWPYTLIRPVRPKASSAV